MRSVLVLAGLLLLAGASGAATPKQGGDWTRFGYDAQRSSSGPAVTGITAANVRRLVRQRVQLDGTVDASPIYLRGVTVGGRAHDTFFVTTTYGKTEAIDAANGKVLWRFTPPGYSSWAGSARITNATPLADPGRKFIYAVSPDGKIHKLSVAGGGEAAGWPVLITRDATHEKIAPPLNYSRGLVLAATGGYIGDAPSYQGHVVSIDAKTGQIRHVWNSLCSDRTGLITPSSCAESDSAIWGRGGVVVAPGTGNLLVATGNGKFDGSGNWGDSALMLSADAAQLLQNWTPTDQATLDATDGDLGTTVPAVLSRTLAVQGGKDGKLRLLDLRRMNGKGGHSAKTGGELQTVTLTGGLFTAPAVWKNWVFVATFSGTQAFRLAGGRLHEAWSNRSAGTSPVVAGGLLYVYDPNGGLNIYRASTGARITQLAAGSGHWNSPIVTDGRVALPEGDANHHSLQGVLDIYRLG